MNGGERVAAALAGQGAGHLFTLCGGHISPILVAAKARGLRVIDVRDEASAVFAADAVARLTGVPGVAAVTAGPGVTNTITAVKNAQLAQSPVVLLGGAAATLLKGRGSLQDIDQTALLSPHVKTAEVVSRVRDLGPAVARAFREARSGAPGPVFVECPVDLLYDETLVREWYDAAGRGKGPAALARRAYLRWHAGRLFGGAGKMGKIEKEGGAAVEPGFEPQAEPGAIHRLARHLGRARRPVLVVGSQALLAAREVATLAEAVAALGAPVYLAGGARGLLGPSHPLQMRHRRRDALKEADFVLLAGIPADFRLDYGRQIGRRATLASVSRSAADLALNRKPHLALLADPGRVLRELAGAVGEGGARWEEWIRTLRGRDEEREREIETQAGQRGEYVNPLFLCREIDRVLAEDSVVVADGGDFVATAAYTVRPRRPLGWLDPGVFGTLGVGGGFALGAKAVRPAADVWLLWGDGSAAFSLAEIDTMARHGLPAIAVVGNDAGWTQIAREQVPMLGDAVGTVLARTDYHRVAEGYGGRGIKVARPEEVRPALAEAVRLAREGSPVVVNVLLGRSEFRKGSLSM